MTHLGGHGPFRQGVRDASQAAACSNESIRSKPDVTSIIEAAHQALFRRRVEREARSDSGRRGLERSRAHVDRDHRRRVMRHGTHERRDRGRVDLDGDYPALQTVRAEDLRQPRRHHRPETGFVEGPDRVLARRAASEVRARDDDRRARVAGIVHDERRVAPPRFEETLTESRSRDALQPVRRDDLVRVDVHAIDRQRASDHTAHGPHASPQEREVAGDGRRGRDRGRYECVRPARTLRLRSCGSTSTRSARGPRMSGFMPRHIEHPASRHSKPASRKTRSSPSRSACAFTSIEPGTTRARTPDLTLRPRTTSLATRRSSIRAFVHEPRKTASTAMSRIGVPGSRSM